MISSWRRRRAARRDAKKENNSDGGGGPELSIPNHFLCPISLELMKDPVTLSTETTYDRHSIETWIESGKTTCPVTNQVLSNLDPIPNHAIRRFIQDWCVENRSHGVDRIPTPRIPITSYEVSDIFAGIDDARRSHDGCRCQSLVAKIKASANESDRNKKCFVSNGAAIVLSAAFAEFSRNGCVDDNVALLAEILSVMIMLTPILDEETSRNLSSSLPTIVWFLRFGNLSGRRNAVLALKSVVSFDENKVDELVKIDGALQGLMKLLKEPICPTTTKASLLAMYYIVKPISESDESNTKKAIALSLTEMGLVQTLLEMVVDSDRSTCEKALGVLDGVCSEDEVRQRARQNALMIPLLVKKILRVSDMATQFAVSVLLKIVDDGEKEAAEALRAGAFQKLLLVLQIGSNEMTKEKVGELLKILNQYRNRVECIDSLDFKHLRRPF